MRKNMPYGDITRLFEDGRAMDRAMHRAVSEALEMYRRAGKPRGIRANPDDLIREHAAERKPAPDAGATDGPERNPQPGLAPIGRARADSPPHPC